ncbi:type 2 periplasmic-binding domain-containing protein [Mycoplasmopsis pulmonis]|uniref:hypothetical protein n=1 Tax=Mycoplasmopsis pulmonis TaxID=2107 RepID=UPI0010050B48|nr:hypothetical protein [Mycoplasmopsis pulmonis]VEU68184.1 Uncharacterised protein [Mycoplasmopsis pulmonis]
MRFKKAFITMAISSALIAIAGVFSTAVYLKSKNNYRPTIMNYEAYISPEGRNKINESGYKYQEFGELNEFSRAFDSAKAVAGFGSDFQIARLIKNKKLSKIDYEVILNQRNLLKEQDFEVVKNSKNEEIRRVKKEKVLSFFRPETVEHMQGYDQYLVDENNKRIDLDQDGKADEMWEFMIPYYIQDKVVAYSVGDYQKSDGTKASLRASSKNLSDQEKEKGLRFDDQSWKGILNTLKNKGYSKFGWTESARDNLLIGSSLEKNGYSGEPTEKNYSKQIDGFLKIVEQGTGSSIKDSKTNALTTSGLALLESLIDPNLLNEVGIIYNGDAIDGLFSSDNFANVEDGQSIRFIRPKKNITLMEGFILSSANSKEENKKILQVIYDAVYKGADYSVDELVEHSASFKKVTKGKNNPQAQEQYGLVLDYSALPILRNFDYINYSPTWKSDFEYFKRYYFNDNTSDEYYTIDEESKVSDEPESIILNENGELWSTQEIKTNIADIKNLNISTQEEHATKLLLNLYITQQKKQSVYGTFVDENTAPEDIYEVVYERIKPIDDKLRTEIISEYNSKTKG